ncbi:MAG: hypothetical protein Q9174_006611, partial [Haloplaca sp. 1 TL-2023]
MSSQPDLHIPDALDVIDPATAPSSPMDETKQHEVAKPVEVDPPHRPEVSPLSQLVMLCFLLTLQQYKALTPEKQTRRGFKPFKNLARGPGMQPRSGNSINPHSLASNPTTTSNSEHGHLHTSSPPTTDASFSATQGKRHAYMEEDFPHSPHSSKDNNAPRHYTRCRHSAGTGRILLPDDDSPSSSSGPEFFSSDNHATTSHVSDQHGHSTGVDGVPPTAAQSPPLSASAAGPSSTAAPSSTAQGFFERAFDPNDPSTFFSKPASGPTAGPRFWARVHGHDAHGPDHARNGGYRPRGCGDDPSGTTYYSRVLDLVDGHQASSSSAADGGVGKGLKGAKVYSLASPANPAAEGKVEKQSVTHEKVWKDPETGMTTTWRTSTVYEPAAKTDLPSKPNQDSSSKQAEKGKERAVKEKTTATGTTNETDAPLNNDFLAKA